jgi:hypothetical protein
MKVGAYGLVVTSVILWIGTALAWYVGIEGIGVTISLLERITNPHSKPLPNNGYVPALITFVIPPVMASSVSVAAFLGFMKIGAHGLVGTSVILWVGTAVILWVGTALAWYWGIEGIGSTVGLLERMTERYPRKHPLSSWYVPALITFVIPPVMASAVSVVAFLGLKKR